MRRGPLALVAALAALALFAAACSSGQATCDCADPAITITIPTDIATSATVPVLTGPACNGAQLSCTNMAGGCSQYQFDATGVGTCHVVVPLLDTTFTADINVIAATGCCTGYFASPASAASIDVPEPPSGDDGGPG